MVYVSHVDSIDSVWCVVIVYRINVVDVVMITGWIGMGMGMCAWRRWRRRSTAGWGCLGMRVAYVWGTVMEHTTCMSR